MENKILTYSKTDPNFYVSLAFFTVDKDLPEINSRAFYIFYFLYGNGIIKINQNRVVIEPPCFIVLNHKDFYTFEENHGLEGSIVAFHPEFINKDFSYNNLETEKFDSGTATFDKFYLIPFLEKNEPYIGYLKIPENLIFHINKVFQSIRAELDNQGAFWPCRTRSYLIELLFAVHKTYSGYKEIDNAVILPPESDEMEKVILYLHSNYGSKLTIESLSRMFNTNRTTLAVKFQKFTGKTINDYAIELRIKLSSMFLRNTNLPINEISNRIGIADAGYFSKLFKKRLGITPSEFRDKYCWFR